jgi:hypothetical protein
MDTTTKIVLNEEDSEFRYFSLEANLFIASRYENTYIVTIFDCCREELPTEELRGGEENNSKATKQSNFYVTYGCPPTKGVPAKSTIVTSYTKCLKQNLNKQNGVIILP